MISPSNLYAEKVFSEHPISLWALDDESSYVSFLTESNRDLSNWTPTNCTFSTVTNISDEPFSGSYVGQIVSDPISTPTGYIMAVSDDLINFNEFSKDLGTFSLGAYFYSYTPYISSVSIGFEYYDATNGEKVVQIKTFETSIDNQWFFVSETFEIPKDNVNVRVVLLAQFVGGALAEDEYKILVNGLSLGQWSEEFNSYTLGIVPQELPSTITSIGQTYGIDAQAYGLQESTGYYIVENNKLLAKNSGIPLVYGASNTTIVYPSSNLSPSLIIPGHGFLNESGKYRECTFETWIRLNADTPDKVRIIGPVSSTDGLYVEGPFLGLAIGDQYATHYVGEWARPMLLHVRIIKDSVSVLLNGDQVISLQIDKETLFFPDQKDELGKDQDWIGFYGNKDISPIEIDCVAIYPYQVPNVVAKRRFVYGQGVEFPENINTAYSGTSVFIDYAFADYTNNYSYPDMGKWDTGILDNLSTQNNTLSTPTYSLPTIYLDNKTESELMSACSLIQNESDSLFTFRPNGSFSSTNGYLVFKSLNILSEETKAIYGVFKNKLSPTSSEVLIRLENQNTGNYLSIETLGSDILYKLKYGGVTSTVYSSTGYNVGDLISVGINLDMFSDYFGSNVASFLGNRSDISVYVGGTKELSQTFKGNIYKVGFCTARNFQQASYLFNNFGVPVEKEDLFSTYGYSVDYDAGKEYFGNDKFYWAYILDGGTPSSFAASKLIDYIASYTLTSKLEMGTSFELDINVNGYWEDYIPLSYFAQYVQDSKGDSYYDLDFIQFNINYPSTSKIIEEDSEPSSWTYQQLKNEYSLPVQRTYESLDNHLYTGYIDYEDLKNKTSKQYRYDTAGAKVKTYITFQYLEAGANQNYLSFTNSKKPSNTGILEPGPEWMNTKYEVIDNTIIYPPTNATFSELAMVMHVEFNLENSLNHKVSIKKLHLGSQAFNSSSPNPVGTRFGTKLYPYKKSGIYFDYKGRNPFSIYKGSSPYLYMTKNSGIELKGKYDPLVNRGISIPINDTLADNYRVMAMQASIKYDGVFFPYAPTQIFEIDSNESLIKVYMVASNPDGTRAKIYAVNATTGLLENGVGFYWNGKIVKEPVMTIREWGFLGISFPTILNFDNYVGAIRVNGPVLINNISHYQSTSLQEVQKVSKRSWFRVRRSGPITLPWDFWDTSFMWNGVLVLAKTSYYGVDPSQIYKSYTGTNKIIVDDSRALTFKSYEYNFHSDIRWTQTVLDAI
jgi:hypothetical protein